MTTRTEIETETERLASDIRSRRKAKELDVREAAEEMAVVGVSDPQALRRLLRAGRITLTDRHGEPTERVGGKGAPWIIPVVDVAHAIILARRGMTFGGWWAVDAHVERHGAIHALRCQGAPTTSTIDPKPGLSALRGALRDLLGALRAAVDAAELDDEVAGE